MGDVENKASKQMTGDWRGFVFRKLQKSLMLITMILAMLTVFYATFSYLEKKSLFRAASPDNTVVQMKVRLNNMGALLDSLKGSPDFLLQLQRDTLAGVLPVEMKPLQDSLRAMSRRVKQLTDAITPQSIIEIIALQRLGDRYEMLTQTVAELKSDLEKSQLTSERTLANHTARINSELNRFTPMIWGMLGTIVLIVIQNIWTQRKKKEE